MSENAESLQNYITDLIKSTTATTKLWLITRQSHWSVHGPLQKQEEQKKQKKGSKERAQLRIWADFLFVYTGRYRYSFQSFRWYKFKRISSFSWQHKFEYQFTVIETRPSLTTMVKQQLCTVCLTFFDTTVYQSPPAVDAQAQCTVQSILFQTWIDRQDHNIARYINRFTHSCTSSRSSVSILHLTLLTNNSSRNWS